MKHIKNNLFFLFFDFISCLFLVVLFCSFGMPLSYAVIFFMFFFLYLDLIHSILQFVKRKLVER